MWDQLVISHVVMVQEGPETEGTRDLVQEDRQEDKETQG